jgi:hypothetical protein
MLICCLQNGRFHSHLLLWKGACRLLFQEEGLLWTVSGSNLLAEYLIEL